MTRPGGRSRVQDGTGVVVRTDIVRVRILAEDGEVAHIVGPVAQGMEVERALHGAGLRRGLDPRERIPVSHIPPPFHVDLHHRPESEGWRPYTGIGRRATAAGTDDV